MLQHPPTRGVILARGLGTRMRASVDDAALTAEQADAAASGVKAMMPIGRPFLDHAISALADAGVTEVCLVIGPEHQGVRDYYDALETSRVRVTHAIQEAPLGTADAVLAAERFAGSERFVVVNGDNYYPAEAVSALVSAEGTATAGFVRSALVARSNIPAERVAAFALLEADADGRLVRIVEKPAAEELDAAGPDPLISMNCWLFGPSIFPACRSIGPSARGEFEIADAVAALMASGERVTVVPVREGVLDLSNRGDVAAVTAALQDRPVEV